MAIKFLQDISNREKTVLIITSVIVSILFLDKLVVGPILDKINMLNTQTGIDEMLLKSNLKLISNKEKINEDFNKFKKYSLVAMAPEDELASLLAEVERLSSSFIFS